MNLTDHLRRQFAYDEWANLEVLAAIRASSADERSLQLMAHILSAERLWLERLKQQPQSSPDDLSKSISYKNSKGEVWTSTIVDILTHVVMHSAYHRGQIASHMRATGRTPAYADFIHAVRQGLVR